VPIHLTRNKALFRIWHSIRTLWSQHIHCVWIEITIVQDQLLDPCSVFGSATIFLTFKISYLLFQNLTHKLNMRCEIINSNPPQAIKLSTQSSTGVLLCCAFCQPQHPVQKCWTKTIFAEPNLHALTLFHPELVVQCTGRVALTKGDHRCLPICVETNVGQI
jgi:hypothetical protein